MKVSRLAIPAGLVLLLGITAISAGQTNDTPKESMAFVPHPMQAPQPGWITVAPARENTSR